MLLFEVDGRFVIEILLFFLKCCFGVDLKKRSLKCVWYEKIFFIGFNYK